jgi:hypothetical protein
MDIDESAAATVAAEALPHHPIMAAKPKAGMRHHYGTLHRNTQMRRAVLQGGATHDPINRPDRAAAAV